MAALTAYIELWSMAQDATALELLRFPSPPLIPPGAVMKASFWGKGRRRAVLKKTVEEIIAYVSRCQANEITVNYKFEAYTIPGTDLVISKALSEVFVPPTSSLWASTVGCKAETAGGIQRLMSSNSFEHNYRYNGVTRAPTEVLAVIEFTTDLSIDETFDLLFRMLPEAIARVPGEAISGGCAGIDCHNHDLYGSHLCGNLGVTLAPWPKTYPMLGDKWDGLHPIMIGPFPRCAALVEALGDVARLTKLEAKEPGIGVIRISGNTWTPIEMRLPDGSVRPGAYWGTPAMHAAAEPWLVPLDETTLHGPARD